MSFTPGSKLYLLSLFIVICMLAACTNSPGTQDNTNTEEDSGTPAMVDSVTVEQRDNHYYAVVNGFYPDACTHVSSMEQSVEGNTISITLLTDRPADVMCAAMLTPFTVDVLLTTGGLMPQEYNIVVNEGPTTTFSVE